MNWIIGRRKKSFLRYQFVRRYFFFYYGGTCAIVLATFWRVQISAVIAPFVLRVVKALLA